VSVQIPQPPAQGERPRFRLSAALGRPPLGAIFGAIGVVAGAAVALLHLDRLPLVFCVFKGLTGLPCPTCGSTRALGRLAVFDLAGAAAMNPLATLAFGLVAAWAVVDLVLLPRRRALSLEVEPRLAWRLRIAALALFLANWVYLLAVRR
jgi:hypothetical protein